MKKTLIIGATTNPDRYAYKAAENLKRHNHPIVPVGIREGEVFGEKIINTKEIQKDIDTITLYVSPENQKDWYDYIIKTNPKRIIFNPGTENAELQKLLSENNIAFEEACTLVLLNTNQYE